MNDMPRPHSFERAAPAEWTGDAAIGFVLAVAGSSSRVVFDRAALDAAAQSDDAVAATAGQVGSQIKMRVGSALAGRQRSQPATRTGHDDRIVADIDFLGEGDEVETEICN